MTKAPARAAAIPAVQRLVIEDWLPAPVLNGSHGNPYAKNRRANADKVMAWSAAKQAGWVFVPGKVQLSITLVFPVNRRRDTDNLYARVKHMVDGLKGMHFSTVTPGGPNWRNAVGWFADDSTDHLELIVRAEVRRGEKRVEMELRRVDE